MGKTTRYGNKTAMTLAQRKTILLYEQESKEEKQRRNHVPLKKALLKFVMADKEVNEGM